jgi:glutamate---cysteine ligase / carboxylate-amine ligase
MDHAFGSGEPFTVGIEEELLLVDPASGRLVPIAEQLLPQIDLPPRTIGHEAYASEIELRSLPSESTAEALGFLERGRDAARAAGASLLAVGLHPAAEHGDARLVDSARYRRVLGEMRGLIQRTPECALHVHVGMPDPAAAIAAFNELRHWLPLLIGLAAGSPYWFGVDSGLASARWAIIRPFPSRGVPRALRDFEDYERALASEAAGGGPDDYTLIWWDVRLHPRLGTVEVREMDVQPRLGDAAAVAALIRALACRAVEATVDPLPAQATLDPLPAETIAWSCFRAARDGLEAEILNDGRLVPVPEAARRAVELARPHARELGDEEELEGIERILAEGGSPARQRAAYSNGGIGAVLELLRAETDAPR